MLPDAYLVPLIYFGGLFMTVYISDCLKYRPSCVLDKQTKKIQ